MTLDSKKIQDINLAYFFFNLTVAKELTPNPGGVYIQDRDIPRYRKLPRHEALNRKVNNLQRHASHLKPLITATDKTKGK